MTAPGLLDPERIARLRNLELVARVVVEGFLGGVHRGPHRGSSAEFFEKRPYVPGDAIAHIDWRAFGKTDRLYLREFEEETNLRLTLLVDASASMGFSSGEVTKFRYASCLAAALGLLLLRQLDAIGLALFDSTVRRLVFPRASHAHLRRILDELQRAEPRGETRLAAALGTAVEALPARGLVVLLSDLLDDPVEILRALSRFRSALSEVVVFHVLDRAEREFPYTGWTAFRDIESPDVRVRADARWVRGAYLERFRDHLDQLRRGCRSSRIDYHLVDTRTPLDVVLSRFLTARRKRGFR